MNKIIILSTLFIVFFITGSYAANMQKSNNMQKRSNSPILRQNNVHSVQNRSHPPLTRQNNERSTQNRYLPPEASARVIQKKSLPPL